MRRTAEMMLIHGVARSAWNMDRLSLGKLDPPSRELTIVERGISVNA